MPRLSARNSHSLGDVNKKALDGAEIINDTADWAATVDDLTPAPTAASWTQDAVIVLKNAAGETMDWYNGPVTTAIADTSSAGTASITGGAGAKTCVNGTVTVEIAGDTAAWLDGDTVTLSLTGTVSGVALSQTDVVITFTA